MLSRVLYKIDGFLRFKNLDSKSYLEKTGDFFLKPIRQVFNGSEFNVILNKDNAHFYYSLISNFKKMTPSLLNRILFAFLLLFSPLGLLIKIIGLMFHENRQHLKYWKTPKKYLKSRSEYLIKPGVLTIDDLMNELEKRNLLHALIEKHFENPANFFEYSDFGNNGRWNISTFLNLDECACANHSHDRLFSDMRFIIQNKILEYAKGKFAKENKEDKSISILSFGSGGGLQDFIILYLLVQMGINNINLTLIDFDYSIFDEIARNDCSSQIKKHKMDYIIGAWEDKRNNVIDGLSKLNKAYDVLKLNLKTYRRIDELLNERHILLHEHKTIPAEKLQFDLVYGIDVDEYYKMDEGKPSSAKVDFNKSIEILLKPNGFSLLSSHNTLVQFKSSTESNEPVIKEQEVETRTTPRLPFRLLSQ
jgi:hypothetical protein